MYADGHMCVWYPRKTEEGKILWLQLQKVVSCGVGAKNQNLGPLQEQKGLLHTERVYIHYYYFSDELSHSLW